jgi:hypothetical protein
MVRRPLRRPQNKSPDDGRHSHLCTINPVRTRSFSTSPTFRRSLPRCIHALGKLGVSAFFRAGADADGAGGAPLSLSGSGASGPTGTRACQSPMTTRRSSATREFGTDRTRCAHSGPADKKPAYIPINEKNPNAP